MVEKIKNKGLPSEWLFVLCVFLFYLAWMVVHPYGEPPDEVMRFDIPMYIFNHGTLPVGNDPELIGNAWGLSYAFFPILSYMVEAVFMKVVAIFTTDFTALLMSARFVSVLFGTGTAFVSLKIGKKLFGGRLGWLFACIVAFLPQNVFISTYVNNDSMAILSTALIVYFWIRGIETKWDFKTCIGLGISLSVCALSYYNAYGFILCSAIIYFATYFMYDRDKNDYPLNKFLIKGFIIVGIVLVLAGWWFIRSAILYNGDFLGLRAMDECAELNAAPGVRPSEHTTPASQGMSIIGMLLSTNWIPSTVGSFVGCFGPMKVKMHMWMYILYGLFFLAAIVGIIAFGRKIFGMRYKDGAHGRFRKKGIFTWILLVTLIIPIGLNMYNSYTSDYQPQGRYILTILMPFAVFITWGVGKLVERIRMRQIGPMAGNEGAGELREPEGDVFFPVLSDAKSDNIINFIIISYVLMAFIAYFTVLLPQYVF